MEPCSTNHVRYYTEAVEDKIEKNHPPSVPINRTPRLEEHKGPYCEN